MRPLTLPLLLLALAATAVAQAPQTRPAPDPAEYARRFAALKDDDLEGRLALARFARDRRMWPQAVDMAESVLYRDPGNRAAYLILQQVDESRSLPEEPATETALKAEFQRRFHRDFKTHNTRHFLLLYDTTDAFAVQRGAVMERIYQSFQFYFNMNTLRPEFLGRRLVVILFKDREDYLGYLRQSERSDLSWSSGFYSQRSNRSAFFDDTSGATAASYARQSEALRQKMEDLTKKIATASAQSERLTVAQLTVERARISDTLAQMSTRAGNAVLMLNNTKTMHEAAHQVAFNIGVQTRLVDYPMWFSEGLACSFETEDALGHKGPAVLNYGRIAGIKEMLHAGQLMPIEEFVRTGSPGKADESSLTHFYAEGWGLFHYLYKFQRSGMEKYLLAYKNQPAGQPGTPEDRVRLFKEAFGDDCAGLDKKFAAYLKALPAGPPPPRAN